MYTPTDPFSDGSGYQDHILHRQKRDLKWSDIEEFYQDKNNFAMYLVLPIIVIVYGGCAVIYCIARCRRYMRRKRKKKQHKMEFAEDEPLDGSGAEPALIPSIPVSSREGATTSTDVNVSVHNDRETPLPWQVPGDTVPIAGAAAAATAMQSKKAYSNKGYDDDYPQKSGHPSPPPPPSYDEMYKPGRPMSKPPPYEEKGIRERRGSVEEIITLDANPAVQKKERYNERKRPRPGSRQSSRSSGLGESRLEVLDEERMKARQLVRGDRPMRQRDHQSDRYDRQKTPDIISHARTQPLQPQYKPQQQDPKAEATLMARQAAQLLRLDQMGKQAGKKQKRLVFVAE